MSSAIQHPSRKRRGELAIWLVAGGGFFAVIGGSLLALWFVHHRGVTISGDEPAYVGTAYALGRLHTWNIGPAFASIGLRHLLGTMTALRQGVTAHGITFPYHGVGYSLLLAPSLTILLSLSAVHVEALVLMSSLVAWLGVEVTKAARVSAVWCFLPVVLFLAPGYLLATTQIYPDLLSGLVLAVVVVRLMVVEIGDSPRTVSLAITGALLFAFVWLDDKNIAIGVLLGLLAVLLSRRKGAPSLGVVLLAAITLVGVVGVVCFDIYAYGHPLGPTQDLAPFSAEGMTKMVALIFDRRHGLLVQDPAVLLGVAGVVRWWRRAPWSVTAGIVAVAVVLVANASLLGGMAGGSFVGRYEWESLPLALAFGGLFLVEIVQSRRRVVRWLVGVFSALAVLEAWALIASRPDATSFMANGWDPAAYVGWWGRLDPSPILNYFNGEWSNARNLWGLGAVLAVALAATLYLNRLATSVRRHTRVLTSLVVISISCWAMALGSPFLLPTPLMFAGSDLGPLPLPVPSRALTVDGPGHQGVLLSSPPIPILPGRYRVSIDYRLMDRTSHQATFEVHAIGSLGARVTVARIPLPSTPTRSVHSYDFDVKGPEKIYMNLTWRGRGPFTVVSIVITKVATCHVVECQGGWL